MSILNGRSAWWAGSAIALFVFIIITAGLLEGLVGAVDITVLQAIGKDRAPWLTEAALNITALGSNTLVILLSAFTLLLLMIWRDRLAALQLLAAVIGSDLLTQMTKDMI